jgi:hypothetical protein
LALIVTGAEHEGEVFFYVNGSPRLLLAALAAGEVYEGRPCSLILLEQYGYDYSVLLPYVEARFDRVLRLPVSTQRYSHFDQFWRTYFARNSSLRDFFHPNSEVVLFGLRSPIEKFIVRHNKALGNHVSVYAGSLDIERYFSGHAGDSLLRSGLRRLAAQAFDYQHDYDEFFVLDPELYRGSAAEGRLRHLPDLYRSSTMQRLGNRIVADLGLDEVGTVNEVFFGQPLSNGSGVLSSQAEESLLTEILGDRPVLVLPHPNEVLVGDGKYAVLPKARVLRSGLPNELLLAALQPRRASTYSSTIAITYALMNREAEVHCYPVTTAQLSLLDRYRKSLPHVVMHEEYVGYRG